MKPLVQSACALMVWLYAGTALAQSGVEAARQLNARYNSTPTQCVGRTPTFYCSGVLLRAVPDPTKGPAWTLTDPGSSTVRFDAVRKDRAVEPLGATAGYVLFDRLTAVARNVPYQASQSPASPAVVQVDAAFSPSAVQGFFYDAAQLDEALLAGKLPSTGGLPQARASQLDYFNATGIWLPVLRLQRNEPKGRVFGFSQQDQVYDGYRTAQRLNARYNDTATVCRDGRAAYLCNGVLTRSVSAGNFHFWNPSPDSIKIQHVSFTYIRRDSGVSVVVAQTGYATRELAAPARYAFKLGCAYAADTQTWDATQTGQNACTYLPQCSALGVNTVQTWRARFAGQIRSCAFGTDAASLALINDIRRDPNGISPWSEWMIQVWPQNLGSALPIEAIYHSTTFAYPSAGLSDSQRLVRDFFEQTGRLLPLVKLDLGADKGQVFAYVPQDQNL